MKNTLKNLAFGVIIVLMASCSYTVNTVDERPSSSYEGVAVVRKIEMGGSKHNYFIVHLKDSQNKTVQFNTDELTFNVGDTIYVNFAKSTAYPLNDPDNVANF